MTAETFTPTHLLTYGTPVFVEALLSLDGLPVVYTATGTRVHCYPGDLRALPAPVGGPWQRVEDRICPTCAEPLFVDGDDNVMCG